MGTLTQFPLDQTHPFLKGFLLDFGLKMANFTRFWKNLKKKKICQNREFGMVEPAKQFGFFFCGLIFNLNLF